MRSPLPRFGRALLASTALSATLIPVLHAQTATTAPSTPRTVVHLDASSLDGWTVDPRARTPPAVADGVLTVDDAAGWLRSRQKTFGTFTLRFAARVTSPATKAVFTMIGATSADGVDDAFAVLLAGQFPDQRRWSKSRLSPYVPDDRLRREAVSTDDWQQFEIARLREQVIVRLNGRVILNADAPVTLDGWIGFRVQDGALQVRDLALVDAPPEREPPYFRPGPGVELPVLVREVKPSYTREAMRAHIEGAVLIEGVVDTDGVMKRAVVVRFLDPASGLDREALVAVSKWRFKPGRREGKPVPVLVTVEVRFELRP